MIRLATKKDIKSIISIVDETIKYINSEEQGNWEYIYPNEHEAEKIIKSKRLFVYEIEGSKIAGFICMNNRVSDEYEKIGWSVKEDEFMVINTLAIDIKILRCGVATDLIKFAEEFAKENLAKAIRTEVYSLNKRAQKLLIKNGYELKGEIYFREIKDKKFYCYEKLI
ncbi:GNAT family N-acetyltransferase [Clostridium senegalense]